MIKIVLKPFIFVFLLLIVGCTSKKNSKDTKPQTTAEKNGEMGLKEYYQAYFPIGVSITPYSVRGKAADLIQEEFNSITAENAMKMGVIHPEKDKFSWKEADAIVKFAEDNDIKIRGHALVWHEQIGKWFFEDENGKEIGKDQLFQQMKTHIDSVMGRYEDKIYAWDVVNEAVSDHSDSIYRASKWYKIGGKEYVAKAFEYAREAHPGVKLFINDYNLIIPEKRDKAIELIKELQAQSAPVDGIGIQGHWSIYGPSEKELREALDLYSELGLEIQITELDISIYPWEKEQRERKEEESDKLTPELKKKQMEVYKMIFDVFRDYKDVITGVTFWNLTDKDSWLNSYPVEGRSNYPLLFDKDYKRKKAYEKVVDF